MCSNKDTEKKRLFFFTSDAFNETHRSLVAHLSNNFQVFVVTDAVGVELENAEVIHFCHTNSIFEKICKFFYRHIEVRAETRLPERVNGSRVYRIFFKFIFNAKVLVQRVLGLPTFSWIVQMLYSRGREYEIIGIRDTDVCLSDANLNHVKRLIPIIVQSAKISRHFCSYVFSWDNTHYSTLNLFSDSYLVWNSVNKTELCRIHGVPKEKIHIVGSLLHDYLFDAPVREIISDFVKNPLKRQFNLLYAATFPMSDPLCSEEIRFVYLMGKHLSDKIKNFRMIFRSYPTKGSNDPLGLLRGEPWCEVYEHKNFQKVARLGLDSQTISFNDNQTEKVSQFFSCDAFLSVGSTYSLEVCYSNTPIIQIDFKKFKERGLGFDQFLDRLCIFEHLDPLLKLDYEQNLAQSFSDIANFLVSPPSCGSLTYSEYLRGFSKQCDTCLTAESIARYLAKL